VRSPRAIPGAPTHRVTRVRRVRRHANCEPADVLRPAESETPGGCARAERARPAETGLALRPATRVDLGGASRTLILHLRSTAVAQARAERALRGGHRTPLRARASTACVRRAARPRADHAPSITRAVSRDLCPPAPRSPLRRARGRDVMGLAAEGRATPGPERPPHGTTPPSNAWIVRFPDPESLSLTA
jgi:hypothetical protein